MTEMELVSDLRSTGGMATLLGAIAVLLVIADVRRSDADLLEEICHARSDALLARISTPFILTNSKIKLLPMHSTPQCWKSSHC